LEALEARNENMGESRRRTEPSQLARELEQGRSKARAVMAGSARIEDLRTEARYHRERYDLYRAKMYAQRPTSPARLRELERAHHGADARLRRAERARASHEGA
jgi:hypothetical protein